MSLDFVPGNSFYHRLHPFVKLLWWVISTILPAALFTDPLILALILVFNVVGLWIFIGLPISMLTDVFKTIFFLSPIYIITSMFFLEPSASAITLFYLWPPLKWLPITDELISYVAGVMLKMLIVLASFRFIPATTPLSDLLRASVKMKVPWSAAMTMTLVFSYIPVMYSDSMTIQEAQKSRAMQFEYRNPVKRFKAMIPMIIPMVSVSIRHSEGLTIAILSRGFGYQTNKRTSLREITFRPADFVAMAVTIAFAAVFIYIGIWAPWLVYYTFTPTLARNLMKTIINLAR